MTRVYLDLMRVYLARGSICKKLFDGPNGMYVCPGKVDMYMNLSISFFFSSEKLSLIYSEVSNKRACTFTNFQLFFHPAHSYYILHILGKIQPALLIDPAHFMCTIWNSEFFSKTVQKVNKIVDNCNLEASDCE